MILDLFVLLGRIFVILAKVLKFEKNVPHAILMYRPKWQLIEGLQMFCGCSVTLVAVNHRHQFSLGFTTMTRTFEFVKLLCWC